MLLTVFQPRLWDEDWSGFRTKHADWLARQQPIDGVLYRLPSAIVKHLMEPLRFGRAILVEAEARAELAFDELCRAHHAEAVYQGQAITYPGLQPERVLTDRDLPEELGWTEAQRRAVRQGMHRVCETQTRLNGYAGRLVCGARFLRERDALRQAWRNLRESVPIGLPLHRSLARVQALPGSAPAGDSLAAFQRDFDAFCDRYGLRGMATWDLPTPAGPNLSGLAWPAHIHGSRSITITLPPHYRVLDADGLTTLVRHLQEQQLRDRGLDVDYMSPRAAETYARLLHLDHYRRAIDSRYGRRPRPKGYVARVQEALAGHLQVGADRFRELNRLRTRHHKASAPRRGA